MISSGEEITPSVPRISRSLSAKDFFQLEGLVTGLLDIITFYMTLYIEHYITDKSVNSNGMYFEVVNRQEVKVELCV